MLLPEYLKWKIREIHYRYLFPYDDVFIHIPKTGGLSYYKSKYKISLGHFSIKQFQEKTKLMDKKYVTIFRNPVDRFLSSVNHLRNNGSKDSQFNDKYLKKELGQSSISEILSFLENNITHLNGFDPIFKEQSFYLSNSKPFKSLIIYNFEKFPFKKKINLNPQKKSINLTKLEEIRIKNIYKKDLKIFSQIKQKKFMEFFSKL